MAEYLREPLSRAEIEVDWIDLRDHPLPMCDGSTVYGQPEVQAMGERVRAADGVILALPIYNYDANAAAKNLIELTGKPAWLNKTVSFICSAGGRGSFMSIMPMANSLMLDFRCVIVPRFVYADDSDFDDGELSSLIQERIAELAEETVRMTSALSQANAST